MVDKLTISFIIWYFTTLRDDVILLQSKQLERTAQAYQHNQKELQEEVRWVRLTNSCALVHLQLTQGKQKMVSMQGFVSQEREKYEKMVGTY